MTTRFFALVFALVFGVLLSAGAAAQTPAVISYGSLVPAESSTLLSANMFTANTFTGTAHYSPIYVAQNNTPAPISPIPTMPSVPSAPASPLSILPPFDPYAAGSLPSGWSSIFPIGTGTQVPAQPVSTNIYSGNFDRFVPETYEAMRRFRDATSFEYTHLPRGSKANGFGMDEIDMRLQLAFPCRFIPNNGRPGYFFVAPAGRLVWWNGPNGPPHISPNGFGAFLDFGVRPKFNDTFSLNALGRVGIFSDFKDVSSDAFRVQGRLEGIYAFSPQMDLQLGVIYAGRARVKMLPTAGIVWRPDDDWILRLVFPNPKISRRLGTGQQADWWGYVHLDYSGGSWSMSGYDGLTDYNDIRLGLGVEFDARGRMGGYFEFGGSFDRELYAEGKRQASLPSVLYLKTGIIF